MDYPNPPGIPSEAVYGFGQAGSHSGREGFYTYNHIPVEVAR